MSERLTESKEGFHTELKYLKVRPILPNEENWWDETMNECHYLGFQRLVGETLKYVAILDNRPVGLLGWGAAAFKSTHRDKWIGWDIETQWKRMKYIANNMRFLVLVRIKNLASKVLSLNTKRLSGDWEARYGHPIVLAETFVDKTRFQGTCYRAAGWIRLGMTKGFGRNGSRYYFHGQPKEILVRPLHSDARQILSAPFLSPVLQNQEAIVDINKANLDGEKGLFKRLSKITDPRKPKGVRHRKDSILAISICACLSGCRNFVSIGEWASDLPQRLLKRFRSRRNPKTGKYSPPSESTIRRTLQKIDAVEIDNMINEWLGNAEGEAIAVDGKTLRGSRTKGKKPLHLVSALLHAEGIVIGQREVDCKSNEITAFRPLLNNIDIKGKTVTADAMHAQKEHATFIKEKGGDYVFVVKKNQRTILDAIRDLDIDFFSR